MRFRPINRETFHLSKLLVDLASITPQISTRNCQTCLPADFRSPTPTQVILI